MVVPTVETHCTSYIRGKGFEIENESLVLVNWVK